MATTTASTFTAIPLVDLRAWRGGDDEGRAALAAQLRRACHEVGFFYLVGHGVPDEFVERYFDALTAFFALPEATKQRVDKRRSPHFRGWERVGAELTDNRTDYREQLDLATEHPPYPHDAEPAYLRIDGPNQWLDEDDLPGFRALVEEFFDRMGAVADELMEVLSVGLGFPPGHLRDRFGERPLSLVKLISYPPTPPGEAGVNPHKDAGFLTLLLQHQVGGLQVLTPDERWIDAEPPPGAIIVNLGEMLQSMTGNYVVATTHRVITRQARVSSAYFHGPDLRASLEPLDLPDDIRDAVAASPRHATAGFMATRDELLAGRRGTSSASSERFGQALWNYYVRSYPDNVAAHHPDAVV